MEIREMVDDDIVERYFNALDELEEAAEEGTDKDWYKSCFDFVGYLQFEIVNRNLRLVTLH